MVKDYSVECKTSSQKDGTARLAVVVKGQVRGRVCLFSSSGTEWDARMPHVGHCCIVMVS